MFRSFPLLAVVLTLGFSLTATDAEAKRLGGARSLGMQRQATVPDKAPAATPAPTQSTAPAAAAPTTAGAPAAAAAAQPKRSWMGPVAGLAAGLGLAALASHLGFGEELASLLLIGLLVVGGLALASFFLRRRAPTPALAGAAPVTMHNGPVFPADGAPAMPGSVADSFAQPTAARPRIPADFDVTGFARNAKVNFIRLQAANDAGDLDDLREFTTPEMFAELKMDLSDRDDTAQRTDVVEIEAEVLEAVEEANRYVVSVRFTGSLREEAEGPLVAVDEVWHLVKARSGKSGWLLAGIQQAA